MTDPARTVAVPPAAPAESLVTREWLVTNGLGGYASGTVGGMPTRRYHGVLIAALPNPAGRVMMLNHVGEQLKLNDHTRANLGWDEPTMSSRSTLPLIAFRLELGLPVWTFGDKRVQIE
ncbi:MAG TPA: glycogen debranching enzyme N-terminal domain-containing protein, partial [Kofleriaceae bacterium]|nr:glycogen debranching enzyme N-terminal domain-containing protein [Kofleriaceae bacterium]